jgi:SAM-dependent methyltransferase
LRFLLDEVFGANNFQNEIIWCKSSSSSKKANNENKLSNSFVVAHDTIFFYTKSNNKLGIYKNEYTSVGYSDRVMKSLKTDEQGNTYYNRGGGSIGGKKISAQVNVKVEEGMLARTWWEDIKTIRHNSPDNNNYPTQKPQALLERIISASSNPNSIVLDCFCGSGTTQAVAQKLGRRWIGCDLNKGAIQTTAKRLQGVIEKQTKPLEKSDNFYSAFLHYKVNNYDFQTENDLQHLVREKYGIQPLKTDTFFDGLHNGRLVKMIAFNNPLNALDIQHIKDELELRKEEERNILIICNGSSLEIRKILDEHNKKFPINKITCKDIQTEGMITNEPATAKIIIDQKDNNTSIKICEYISPTILKRLELDRTIFDEQIKDFRSMIDSVLIDTNYDNKNFNVCISDIPASKKEFVKAEYKVANSSKNQIFAVKITDMLGEELLRVST